MAILPIDMQVTYTKAVEATRNAANDQRQAQLTHNQAAETFQRELNIREQRVNESNKAEKNTVDKDGKNNQGRYKGEKGKKKTDTKKDKPEIKEGLLDIQI